MNDSSRQPVDPSRAGRAERWAAAENQRRQDAYAVAARRWHRADRELENMIHTAGSYTGSAAADACTWAGLGPHESVYLVVDQAWLVETRRAAGTTIGGYAGFSFTVAQAPLQRVGGPAGTTVHGGESLVISDEGSLVVTSERVLFRGAVSSREWTYDKQFGVEHDPLRSLTLMHVSDRRGLSGFGYPPEVAAGVRFLLTLAIARAKDATGQLIGALEQGTLDFASAAALPLVTITAWEGLFDRARIDASDHVLVHAEFEWAAFNRTVTDWERARYFERI